MLVTIGDGLMNRSCSTSESIRFEGFGATGEIYGYVVTRAERRIGDEWSDND